MFGLLLLAGMLITYCKRKGYRIILSNFSFIKLLAVSIIFCCIIVESITHDASQLVHVVYFMASFILLSFAALGRYGIVCVALGLLVLIFKYIVTHVFGFAFNAGLLDVILDANSTEIAHFITPANIAFATGALVITTMLSLAAYWSIRRESRITMATSAIVYALFAYIGVSITIPRINRTADIYCPYSSWWNIQEVSYQARLNRENLIRLVKELPSAADKDSECKTLKGDEGAVVIVHIGESVRTDHMGYAGYYRNTTPWLSQQDNLIKFNQCTSLGPSTKEAVFVMMTNARRNVHTGKVEAEMLPTCLSFVDLFGQHNFECHAFLHESAKSFHQDWEVYFKTMMDKFLQCCKGRHYYQGSQRDQTEQITNVTEAAQRNNLLLIINNEGSHLPFHTYDEQSTLYTPCCKEAFFNHTDKEQEKKAINAYDNTIVLLDQCIESIIKGLGNRPYLYLYTSDHGEPLGDDGTWDRIRDERYYLSKSSQVPFFVLYSESFKSLHPHFSQAIENLRANSGMCISHEHLFHTILGTVGIQSPYYNPTLDLSTENPLPYSGPKPGPMSRD